MSTNVTLNSVEGKVVANLPRGKLIVVEGTDGSGKSVQTRILEERLRKKEYCVQVTDFPQYGNSFFADMIEKYLKGEYGWPQELRDHLKTHPLTTQGRDEYQLLAHDYDYKSQYKSTPTNETNSASTHTLSGSVIPRPDEVNPYLSSLLYAGDRWMLKDKMTKWLDQGVIITSNRYVCSNMAHQGAKIKKRSERNRFFKWIEELEYRVFAIPKPDLVIYLSVPVEISQRLIMERMQDSKGEIRELDMHEKDTGYLHAVQMVYEKLAEADNSWFTIKCVKDNKILPRDEIAEQIWSIVKQTLHKE